MATRKSTLSSRTGYLAIHGIEISHEYILTEESPAISNAPRGCGGRAGVRPIRVFLENDVINPLQFKYTSTKVSSRSFANKGYIYICIS